MSVQNIDLVEENAFDDTTDIEPEKTPVSIDTIEAALNEFDAIGDNTDNGDDAGANNAEEPATIEQLQGQYQSLRDDYNRLVNVVSRMVTLYGARMGNYGATGVEAFKPTSVEPKFPDTLQNAAVPNLGDITLG